MTIMQLSLVGTKLSAARKAELVDRLMGEFATVEVGEDKPIARSGFVVDIDEREPGDVFMGNVPMADAGSSGRAAILKAQVMAGPWTDAMKAELHERLERVVRELAEMPREGRGSEFWMTIVEVEEGGWSVGGKTVSIGDIAPVFEQDRQQRIAKYLASRHEDDG